MARKMKDSGIEWIGEIPEGWEVVPVKRLCTMQAGKNLTSEQIAPEGTYPVYGGNGIRGFFSDYNCDGQFLTVGRQGALCGNVHKINGKVWATEHAVITTPSSYTILDFLYYLLIGMDLNQYVSSTAAQPGLAVGTLLNLKTCYPCSTLEQTQISNYLNAKCSEIDDLLTSVRSSIEEYKKLKQTVITHAVTKGVRGEREMKDSGVEWIGEIPAEWKIQRFARVAEVKSNLVSPDNYLEYPQISPENIEKDSGKLLLPCRTVSEVGVISGNHLFYKGQILYSKIRPKLNKVCIAPFDGLCSADMYPIESKNDTRYIVYCILSNGFLQQVSMITENRVKMPKVNQVELSKILVAIPETIAEQKEIADYLDTKCAEIDGLIVKKEQLVKELESYKKSLIYEVVTGKREV